MYRQIQGDKQFQWVSFDRITLHWEEKYQILKGKNTRQRTASRRFIHPNNPRTEIYKDSTYMMRESPKKQITHHDIHCSWLMPIFIFQLCFHSADACLTRSQRQDLKLLITQLTLPDAESKPSYHAKWAGRKIVKSTAAIAGRQQTPIASNNDEGCGRQIKRSERRRPLWTTTVKGANSEQMRTMTKIANEQRYSHTWAVSENMTKREKCLAEAFGRRRRQERWRHSRGVLTVVTREEWDLNVTILKERTQKRTRPDSW